MQNTPPFPASELRKIKKKKTLTTHIHTLPPGSECVSCVHGWEQLTLIWAGQAVPMWGEKKKKKKRQSILNHNVHSSLMWCTPGYQVSGAEREGTGPSPAIGTRKTTEAMAVKELQEEEKPHFSG